MKNIHRNYWFAASFVAPACLLVSACNRDRAADNSNNNAAPPPTANAIAPAANADNTALNARDRDDNTLTSGDQGTTDADRETTRKIRRALVSDTKYSATAKNVKIITVNGKVTLRGPVDNDTEKSGIDSIAKEAAGADNVDNQLEIKTNQ